MTNSKQESSGWLSTTINSAHGFKLIPHPATQPLEMRVVP